MELKLKIEYLPVEDLEAYKNNTRKHGKEDVDKIAKSIEKFGFDDPIGIWSDHNVIVEGHGRLMAAKKLGMNVVPCIRLDHLTDEERREYGIMHNKTAELSEWDREMLEKELADLDLSDFDLDWGTDAESGAGGDSAEPEEDNFEPQPRAIPHIQRGDIILLGRHKLICGDSTKSEDINKLMAGTDGASLLITDPPYNVALGTESGHALRPSEAKQLHRHTDGLVIANDSWENDADFIEFLKTCYENALDHMTDGAPYYIWYASTQSYNFLEASKQAGMEIREQLIWVKSTFALGRQDYHWRHEPCLYGWKDGAAHYFVDDRSQSTIFDDNADIDKMTKQEMQAMLHEIMEKHSTTVLYEAKPTYNDLHPTMKPVKLIGRLMKNSSKPGDIVLDIFGGSGTTLIAAEQLGRTCYMVEYDPSYAECIIDRYVNLTGDKDGVCIMRGEQNLTYDEIKSGIEENVEE